MDNLPDNKSDATEELCKLNDRIADLQQRFYIDRSKKLLIYYRAWTQAVKIVLLRTYLEVLIRKAFMFASFEKPSTRELSHDYLWRIHKRAPKMGEIVIFDRSHYEDVLAVRVNQLKPDSVWRKRFRHINDFEQMLVDEDTIIIKFFLHIDREVQRSRLQERLDKPIKNWKFDPSDLDARSIGKSTDKPTKRFSARQVTITLHGM